MSVSTFLRPTWMTVPDWDYTLGGEVAELCTEAGFAPDGPQRLILDATFAFKDNRPAAFEVVVIGPRQNIKTGVLKQMDLGFTFLMQLPLVVWSAHEVSMSTQSFRDLVELIETHAFLERQVARIYRPEGRERIELRKAPGRPNGGEVRFKARTRSGGRGLTGDKTVLDEGFALKASHLGALLPVMMTRRHGQVIYASSAGMADSDVLRALRNRGRRGDRRLAYFEYGDTQPNEGCALDDCDHATTREGCALDDRSRWWKILPALGTRVTEDAVADLRRSMPPEEFAREVLGWWDEAGELGGALNLSTWAARQQVDTVPTSKLAMAVHVSPDRSWAAVGTASLRPDGRMHVEVIEHQSGTSWLLPYVEERLRRRTYQSVVGSGASLGQLVDDMEHLPGFRAMNGVDVRRACSGFHDLVTADDRLAVRPHPDLDDAVRIARRSNSMTGEWVFTAPNAADLSALYAVALAAHAARLDGDVEYDVSASLY